MKICFIEEELFIRILSYQILSLMTEKSSEFIDKV
jgi:hypothetical protein